MASFKIGGFVPKNGVFWADLDDDEEFDKISTDAGSSFTDATYITDATADATKSANTPPVSHCWHFGSPTGCIMGANCKFAHTDKETSIKLWKGTKTCKFYTWGKCTRGKKCEFKHI